MLREPYTGVCAALSPPARGAWIEIMMEGYSIYRMLSDRAKDLKAKADAK